MDPFTDVITKVLWRYLKKDGGDQQDSSTPHYGKTPLLTNFI